MPDFYRWRRFKYNIKNIYIYQGIDYSLRKGKTFSVKQTPVLTKEVNRSIIWSIFAGKIWNGFEFFHIIQPWTVA